MAESATLLSLPQMVDVALNTPEIGIVNFTVLRTLLHVIIKQLDLSDTNVEFRGIDSERIQSYIIAASKTSQPCSLTLTDYSIPNVSSEKPKRGSKNKGSQEGKDSKEDAPTKDSHEKKEGKSKKEVSEKKASSKDPPEKKPDSRIEEEDEPDKPEKQDKPKPQKKQKTDSIIVVNSDPNPERPPSFTLILDKKEIDDIKNDIKSMKEQIQVLTDLPANPDIIKVMRSSKENIEETPVLDMYKVISLTKRVNAAEIGIEKLATLMEDIVKENTLLVHSELEVGSKEVKTPVKGSPKETHPDALEGRVANLEKIVQGLTQQAPPTTSGVAETETTEVLDPGMDISKLDINGASTKQALLVLHKTILTLKQSLESSFQVLKELEGARTTTGEGPVASDAKLKVFDAKFREFTEQLTSLDSGIARQISTLTNRISDMEKELGEILEQIHLGTGIKPGETSINELKDMVTELQEHLESLSQSVNKLNEDAFNTKKSLEVMTESIEILKIVKADKEDLEDALADKADICLINRKVSFEQFDQAYNDMSKNIETAMAKLSEQEDLWNQALEDIQKHVGSKMDRNELNPLKEFINSKLKNLQDKFKALSAMKKEHEAAGTKSKYLRNVNCISCDKDVVMQKQVDPSLWAKPPTLPPNRSMAPYLAYELDQLRKQQKCLPTSKNMNMLENALMNGKLPKGVDHLCNRYCGGSHTVTTPQQRVTRMGHFLEQWGPEIAPVEDVQIRGTDGKMYRARDDEHLKQLASEKPPSTKTDQKAAFIKVVDAQAESDTNIKSEMSVEQKEK